MQTIVFVFQGGKTTNKKLEEKNTEVINLQTINISICMCLQLIRIHELPFQKKKYMNQTLKPNPVSQS